MKDILKPTFATTDLDEFVKKLASKGSGYEKETLYYRDGYSELALLEKKVAELVDTVSSNLLLTNSGMSAIVTALDIASLHQGDSILFGRQGYNQAQGYINEELRGRGVRPIGVDAGSLEDIGRAVEKYHPTLLFFETVGNGIDMPVLDLEGLLHLDSVNTLKPYIIIDNTLPTNTHIKLSQHMRNTDLSIVGVESATKFYAKNTELGGILFTEDQGLLELLRRKRQRLGTTLGPAAAERIQETVPSLSEFTNQNQIAGRNTLILAQAVSDLASESGIYIAHPNLSEHPNSELADNIDPNGISPVCFIQSESDMECGEIIRRLSYNGVLDDCYFSQSFGFDKTGIYVDSNYIRIAGGLESEEEISLLATKLRKGLKILNKSS